MMILTPAEAQRVAAGKKPMAGEGIVDFFIWMACGFHHNYVPTGRTRTEIDLVFPVTFYESRCRDCGHTTWMRMTKNQAYVQGPKIGTPTPAQ